MPYGKVKEVQGNIAVVTMERHDMCGDCHACEMLSSKKQCTLRCECQVPCKVGDRVEVSITNEYFLKATYLVYGIPLVGFLIGLAVGSALAQCVSSYYRDLVVAMCIILGTGMGIFYIKTKEKKKAYQKFLPKVTGKKDYPII